MAIKIIMPTGTKAPDADLIDGSDNYLLNNIDSEQVISVSSLDMVSSTDKSKTFKIDYLESSELLSISFTDRYLEKDYGQITVSAEIIDDYGLVKETDTQKISYGGILYA